MFCVELMDGGKSPINPSPPPALAAQMFHQAFPLNRDGLTHSPDHLAQHRGIPPVVSALFNSSVDKSGNGTFFIDCFIALHLEM